MSELKPGPELDALIAEKVMGCKVVRPPSPYEDGISQASQDPRCGCDGRPHGVRDDGTAWIKDYSTDIAAAWEVVNHLVQKNGRGWLLLLQQHKHYEWTADFGDPSRHAAGTTAPHAICLAALKAVGD